MAVCRGAEGAAWLATRGADDTNGPAAPARALFLEGFALYLAKSDARCADASLPRESVELLVGAELTRRAFTNACNIMQRHGFAKAWARWRQ